MAGQSVVQVSRLLDERGLRSFHYNLMFWCVLLSLIDGYDIAAIAFAAPHLMRDWGLKPGGLGPVFSASLIGILFGSALFGWIGDRYGRKAALIGSNLLFGVFTLWAAHAPISTSCSGCVCSPASASAASFQTSSPSTANPRRANIA